MAGGDTETGANAEIRIQLSPPQQRLWFLHQLDPEDPAYNVGLAVALHGPLNPHWCSAVVDAVERRHPALRMRFGAAHGTAFGTMTPPARVPLPIVQSGPVLDQQTVLAAFARKPVNLESGPPTRWCLVAVGRDVHILALVVHHIVFDGASVGPLVADLEALTSAARMGVPATPIRPRPISTKGRIVEREADLQYWRKMFVQAPPPINPWPVPDSASSSASREVPTVRTQLDPSIRADFVATGRRHRTGVLAPVAAAVVAILHRYTAAADVVLGIPTRDDGVPGIGHRVNVLPVRIGVSRAGSYDDLVGATREAILGALEHRTVPFEDIVDAARPTRAAGVTPLFQVLLVSQELQDPPVLAGLDTRLLDVPTPAAKYALEITVTDGGDTTELSFQADPRLCTPETLGEFVSRFQAIARAALATPGRPIGQLSMDATDVPPSFPVRRRATRQSPTGDGGGVYEAVLSSVVRGPDRVAVRAADGQLTYGELDRQARRTASVLREAGVGPEQVVAVCLERGLALPVSMLAVARTGAAFLPLDPGLPDDRLRVLLEDSGAIAFIGSRATAERCRYSGTVVSVGVGSLSSRAVVDVGPAPGHPELAAYVLATSGSTGRPKLVVMRRAGFTALMTWSRETFDVDDLSAVAALTSVGFDLSVFEFFAPLSVGGTVHLLAAVGDLGSAATLRHATLVNTVPSVLETMLDLRLLPLSTVAVNVAGEPLSGDLVDRVLNRRPVVDVRNLYGPTEATTYVTGTGPLTRGSSPSIGRAIAGARLRVTDDDDQPVPTAVPGELRIGGTPLARGYMGAAGLTAQSFVPDPRGTGARVYRTGDIVRVRAGGDLDFVGRRDHQVKVRGVRIELEEVQAVLRRHPGVRQCVVAVRGVGRDRRLIGCVETGDGPSDVGSGTLSTWLRERLPEVMVPQDWVIVSRLPLTSNGKIDRAALATLPTVDSQLGSTPPTTSTEFAVAECWHAVLGRSDIGIHDVFFDAGGNSLTLMLLHAALQERLDPDIRLADLFRRPTVAGQAEMVDSRGPGAPHDVSPPDGAAAGAARGSARREARTRRSRER